MGAGSDGFDDHQGLPHGHGGFIFDQDCPDNALQMRDKKIIVTEFLCEDCNECGMACPDKAIKIKKITF